ncbi:MAG: phosphogluconate dehydrogenase C-terminal domain-containing protein [Spirochaetota bacterium]
MSNNNTTITIMGAGGKMGTRIVNNLVKTNYNLQLCEKSNDKARSIREKGLAVVDMEDAVPESDVVIMAVPDAVLGKVSKAVVPRMNTGAVFILLDPAAAYAKEIALRDDCTFVATHPCHPALFDEQETPEARKDLFGGIAAKQDIVIALLQGSEQNFEKAENICTRMFAPVVKAHRVTVEQMAMLEPAMAEVVGAACITKLKEAMDEVIKRGVPEEAARAFMLGHINVCLAIVFKSSNPFSDAAVRALNYGSEKLFKENWKQVFEEDSIKKVLHKMLHPEK